MTTPIADVERLVAVGGEAVLIDARPRRQYEEGHLEGAVSADLELELSAPGDPREGGRHPLPDLDAWCRQLGQWGIAPGRPVVVYDAAGGAMAACRCWWMLRALGHEPVAVLDGGLTAALAAGLETTTAAAQPAPTAPYPVAADSQGWSARCIGAEELDALRSRPETCVIDVRAAARYRGESDPYDPNPGHVPGAVNCPYDGNLDAEGRWRDASALGDRYSTLLQGRRPEDAVVYCGSGVTACHTLLALEAAGLSGARLYVGSWSEWGRSERPRATMVGP